MVQSYWKHCFNRRREANPLATADASISLRSDSNSLFAREANRCVSISVEKPIPWRPGLLHRLVYSLFLVFARACEASWELYPIWRGIVLGHTTTPCLATVKESK